MEKGKTILINAAKNFEIQYAELQDLVARELDNYLGREEELCPDEHLARALWEAGYRKVANGN